MRREGILPILLLCSGLCQAQQFACKDPGDWTVITSFKFERHSWNEKNTGLKKDSVCTTVCNAKKKTITQTIGKRVRVIPYAFVEDSASTGDPNYRSNWYVYHTPGFGNIIYKKAIDPAASRVIIHYPWKFYHEYYTK